MMCYAHSILTGRLRELRELFVFATVLVLIGFITPRLSCAANEPHDESVFFASAEAAEFTPNSVVIPPRPAWVAAIPQPGDRSTVVSSGPFVTREECERQLTIEIDRAIDRYLETTFHSDRAARLLDRDRARLREQITAKRYEETIQVSLGPMKQIHARLEFSEAFLNEATSLWKRFQLAERLLQFAIATGVVLAFPAGALAYHHAAKAKPIAST